MFVCVSEKKTKQRRWAAIEVLNYLLRYWFKTKETSFRIPKDTWTKRRFAAILSPRHLTRLKSCQKKKREVFIQLYWINFNKEIKKQHLWVGGGEMAGDV